MAPMSKLHSFRDFVSSLFRGLRCAREQGAPKKHAKLPEIPGSRSMTPEEYYRPGILVTDRLNSGDLSEISHALMPIVELGVANGGVRCVEVDAYVGCHYHIIMWNPLAVTKEECLSLTKNVECFTHDYDPHFTLPDMLCFKCSATGDIVAFPRHADWDSRRKRT
jgi:hypothetical protein